MAHIFSLRGLNLRRKNIDIDLDIFLERNLDLPINIAYIMVKKNHAYIWIPRHAHALLS